MRKFVLILLLFSFFQVHAQQENIVDTAFTGQIIKDKTKNTRIYLTAFQQVLDSTGTYTTTYIFGSKMSKPTIDVDMDMKFDKPLIPDGFIGFQYGPYGTGRYSGSGALKSNNTYLYLKGQFISPGHHFYIKIKSKQKPQPVINGIDGQASF
ncbi:MAG: hypothetical protein ACTHK0_00995 [Ginsengibacter sp.]